jgi:hypothetical protein
MNRNWLIRPRADSRGGRSPAMTALASRVACLNNCAVEDNDAASADSLFLLSRLSHNLLLLPVFLDPPVLENSDVLMPAL